MSRTPDNELHRPEPLLNVVVEPSHMLDELHEQVLSRKVSTSSAGGYGVAGSVVAKRYKVITRSNKVITRLSVDSIRLTKACMTQLQVS